MALVYGDVVSDSITLCHFSKSVLSNIICVEVTNSGYSLKSYSIIFNIYIVNDNMSAPCNNKWIDVVRTLSFLLY